MLKVRAQLDSMDQFEGAVDAVVDGLRPQPRSRIALAAAIRAAGGVLGFRITAARTLIAVLVRARASERISVSDLAICVSHFGSVLRNENRPAAPRCPVRRRD